jgi:hypothetical protein
MDDERRRWAAELRERRGMAPAGVADAEWRLKQAAAQAFLDFFGDPAPEPLAIGDGDVFFDHRGALIIFDATTGDLYYQHRDVDGNRYGNRAKLETLEQAIVLFETGGVNREA